MALSKIPSAGFQDNVKFRNIIINGDMSIAQRGTSETGISNTTGYFTCDRWRFLTSGTGTWTQSQSTDVPSGQGFANSIKLDCTTSNTQSSADYLMLNYNIEGQHIQYLKKGTSNAESLTVSFWTKSNKTGTYTFELDDTDNNRSISKTYTVDSANTWEKKTITIEGDTTGTLDNDNNKSLRFYFWFSAGSGYTSGTLQTSWQSTTDANRVSSSNVYLGDSTNDEVYITGVQLEAGTTASDFEFLPHDVNRRRCDRYFQRILSDSAYTAFGAGTVYSSTIAPTFIPYRLEMRSSPTFSVSNLTFTQGDASRAVTSVSSTNAGKSSLYIDLVCSSGMTVGRGGIVVASNNTGSYIQMDAEL